MNEIVKISSPNDAFGRSRKSHVTEKQRSIMLDFMEEHSAFQRGELVGPQGRLKQAELRLCLANKLNACGDGVAKDPTKWMKSWQDWKNKVKTKASSLKSHQRGTGGGSPLKKLTSNEERLLTIMTVESITGDDNLPEGGARRNTTPEIPAALGKAPDSPLCLKNLPIDILDDTSRDFTDNMIMSTPEATTSGRKAQKRKGDKEEKCSSKKKCQSTQNTENLVQSYLSTEDERLSIERERLTFEKDMRTEELRLRREELAISQRNSDAFIHAAQKMASLADCMTSYFQNKNNTQ